MGYGFVNFNFCYIRDLISIRIKEKCFFVYSYDFEVVIELFLYCMWGVCWVKNLKVVKGIWY